MQNYANCPEFIVKNEWIQTFESLCHHVWWTMLEKCHKLHPKPKTTDELKVVLQTNHLGKAATRTHQQGDCKLHQALDCLQWLWLPVLVTLNICSNSVHLQVCILISSPKNRLFSQTPTDYWWRRCKVSGGWGDGYFLYSPCTVYVFSVLNSLIAGLIVFFFIVWCWE